MKRLLLPLLFATLHALIADAQPIVFSHFEEPYEEITDSISVTKGLVWEYDDFSIPIGFDWEFNGKRIDSLYIDSGDVGLLTDISYNSELDLSDVTYLVPAFFYFMDRAVSDSLVSGDPRSQSPLSYKVEGSPGSRIFKFQAKDLAFDEEINQQLAPLSYCNFQVWIYEEDNSVEYRYGPREVYHPETAYGFDFEDYGVIGFAPSVNEEDEELNQPILLVAGDLAMPSTYEYLDYNAVLRYVDSLPPSGMVYRFSFEPSSTEQVVFGGEDLTISPNPAAESIEIAGLHTMDVDHVRAVDVSGRVFELSPSASTIDVSFLPTGQYEVLVVEQDGSVHSSTMIKVR